MTSTGDDAGFTLIELMVSLILLAAVLAMLPGAFRTAQRVWSSEVDMAAESQLNATRAYLGRTLSAAMPLVTRRDSGQIGLAFSGTAGSVSFVAPARSGPEGAGLYWHTLMVQIPAPNKGDWTTLVLRQSMYPMGPNPAAGEASERTLFEAAAGLRFRFFGAEQAGGARQWREAWTRRDALPELIELSVPDADPGGRSWLPLTVRPQLGSPG